MNYEQAKKLITSQGKFYINLGLERISAILKLMGNPQDKLKYFHVAGTNGKGSVCAILASVLQEHGEKVALYTSPHIFEYTERIKINNIEITQNDFAEYVNDVCTLSDKNGIHLTEFEILTTVAFKYFADKNVDVVILETGLGGKYDATNVIKNNLCAIITHIDLDHTERLGYTKEEIATEKAGIIKENCPIVTSEGYEIIKDTADKKNSLFMLVAPYADTTNLSLKGLYQQENLSLALAALSLIYPNIEQSTIEKGLAKVQHQCRFQLITENIIVDGAHNPNGIKALRESLDFYYPSFYRRFVFGCLKNKNYAEMIKLLFEARDEIYFYHFNNPNSCSVKDLQAVCSYPSKEFKTLKELPPKNNTITVICGSFYMLSEILKSETLQ